jgi:Lysozyme like domain/Ricin-type beta-trefoil lectin domain
MQLVTTRGGARLVLAAAISLPLMAGATSAWGSSGPRPLPRPGLVASLAPHGAAGRLAAAQAVQAAQACAKHASAAGFANNATSRGNLATAAAICVAESGGRANVYHCEATGTVALYPPVTCAHGSYDRGLWQLNSQYQASVPDTCAFRGQCNANAAYLISGDGTSFAPWTVYLDGSYASYLGDAQAAVNALHAGAVASAILGVCLSRAGSAEGAAAIAGTCGRHVRAGRWSIAGSAIRHRSLCLAAASSPGQPAVELSTCSGAASQSWHRAGLGGLRNAATGTCLSAAGAARSPGTPLRLASCSGARAQTWWLP